MAKSLVRLIVLVTSLAFASWTWAGVHGFYPGLSGMIGYSESVVVASIVTGANHDTRSGWAVQRVKLLSVLKGDLREQDEMYVELSLTLLVPPATDFPVNERYILFISSDFDFPGHKRYFIVNNHGSAFRIPRRADLSGLKPQDVRGNVVMLVNATLSDAKSRGQPLPECIHRYLSDEPDTRDQQLWNCGRQRAK